MITVNHYCQLPLYLVKVIIVVIDNFNKNTSTALQCFYNVENKQYALFK